MSLASISGDEGKQLYLADSSYTSKISFSDYVRSIDRLL